MVSTCCRREGNRPIQFARQPGTKKTQNKITPNRSINPSIFSTKICGEFFFSLFSLLLSLALSLPILFCSSFFAICLLLICVFVILMSVHLTCPEATLGQQQQQQQHEQQQQQQDEHPQQQQQQQVQYCVSSI